MRIIIAGLVAVSAACAGQAPDTPNTTQDAAAQTDAPTVDAEVVIDAPTVKFSFFVSSTGGPTGGDFRANAADLDGLAGADALCQAKAAAAVPASATKTWRAYLSTDAVDARDRIGTGPWFNKNDVMVASSVANLHDAANNNLSKATSLDETGAVVPGTGDAGNVHDILTGSLADGTKAPNTCANWTSSVATGVTANIGHHDRNGDSSWNAAHATQGCSAAAFVATAGRGSIYCFATN